MQESENFEIPLSFKKDEETMSVGELWEQIAKIANGRVEDNKRNEKEMKYPLELRSLQISSLDALVNALKLTHHAMYRGIKNGEFDER